MVEATSKLIKYSFLIVVALITLHTFLMNGHKHVHPLLTVGTYLDPMRAKADPSLFKNSIYVQAVNRTGSRLSLFYDISPFIIKKVDIETFAIVQSVVSLFFMLAGIFVLTKCLFNSPIAGYIAMLLYTPELNNWTLGSPAPYANFFHHGIPYSYPLLVWSMVFFFQKRYPLSLLLTGISWNFHPMITVFLLFAYLVYGLCNRKEFTLSTLLSSMVAFGVPALPMSIRAFHYLGKGDPYDSIWLTVVRWTAWYTCFPSTWPLLWIFRAGLFLVLFIVAVRVIPRHSVKRNITVFTSSVGIMCLTGTVFADYYPIPFIIKLSLWRSSLLYIILALPCIGYLLTTIFDHTITRRFLVITLVVLLTGYLQSFKFYYLPFLICFLLYALHEQTIMKRFPRLQGKLPVLFFLTMGMLLLYQATFDVGVFRLFAFFAFTILFLFFAQAAQSFSLRMIELKYHWLLPALFLILFDASILYYKGGPEIYYHGRFKGRLDPWADIQMFARKHSHKNDLFIIPPYLNDFGVYSLRATTGVWTEGGNALYLDNVFAHQWLSRMDDLGWRRMHGSIEGYNNLSTHDILRAATKYGARFVITEKPKTFDLEKIYENHSFLLYRLS